MRLARKIPISMNSVALALFYVCMLLGGIVQAARESTRGYDADLTLFSPEGRLYQVEYVMRAVGRYGCPMVGVHGETCCVVACKRDLPDDLVYPDSVTNIFRVTDDIYITATGMSGDVRYQVKRARLQALEYKRQYGSSISSRLLAVSMADAAQVNTQHAAMRPMACVSLLASVDDLSGPLLMRVEPSGQVFQAWGSAAGRGSATSLEFLEEAYEAARREREDVESPAPSSEINESAGYEFGGRKSQGSEDGGDRDMDGGDEESGESPEASGRGQSLIGFGVVGEEETVQLALQALSKASLGKDSDPLSPDNVEIAVASRDKGIRVCSRTEVKGFLGRMACSPGLTPKFGR